MIPFRDCGSGAIWTEEVVWAGFEPRERATCLKVLTKVERFPVES